MTNDRKYFLLVDDDPLNNILSKMALKKGLGDVIIKEFIDPELALDYIQKAADIEYAGKKLTIFLDINMPSISGWEFIDRFNTFSELIKSQFDIYILSSSIDPSDIQRAELSALVIDFLEKPLKKERIIELFG